MQRHTALKGDDRHVDRLAFLVLLDRLAGGLLLLTTDGLPNSFADDTAFDQFARSLRQRIQDHGPAGVTDALQAWLDHYSDQGSGDDMTLVIVDVPPINEHSTP